MRRIIFLLLCMFGTFAYSQEVPTIFRCLKDNVKEKIQDSLSFNGINYKYSYNRHLDFCGFSMNNKISNFTNYFERRGFTFEEDPLYGINGKGSIFGTSGFDIFIDYDDTNEMISYISATKHYKSRKEYDYETKILYKQILQKYPKQKFYNSILVDENFIIFDYIKLKIFDQEGYYVGNLYLITDYPYKKENESFNFTMKFVDLSNMKSQQPITYKNYDLSRYTPSFQSCKLKVNDVFLQFLVKYNGVESTVFAINEDRDWILEKLFYNNISEKEKSDLIKRYLNKTLSKIDGEVLSCSQKLFGKTSYDYEYEVYERNRKLELINEAANVKTFAEAMFSQVYGFRNVVKFKEDGSYAKRLETFKKSWNTFVDSGSNSSTTNWDNLNDAQKAVIHEHDNAR